MRWSPFGKRLALAALRSTGQDGIIRGHEQIDKALPLRSNHVFCTRSETHDRVGVRPCRMSRRPPCTGSGNARLFAPPVPGRSRGH